MGERKDLVTVQPFCMDVTEVTADAYRACVASGQCTADHQGSTTPDGTRFNPEPIGCNYGVAQNGKHPMNCVDWDQSVTFCRVQGRRLPTEEEWEWAARGGPAGRTYPWGNAPSRASQTCSSAGTAHSTCKVGSYPGGDAPGGIHDLAGNVAEWTSSPAASPFKATARVTRGGSFNDGDASLLSAAYRSPYGGLAVGETGDIYGEPPWTRGQTLGFRCVLTPQGPADSSAPPAGGASQVAPAATVIGLNDINKASLPPGGGVDPDEVAKRYGRNLDEVLRRYPEITGLVHRVAPDFDLTFAFAGTDNVACYRLSRGRELLAVYGQGPQSSALAPSAFVYDAVAKLAAVIEQTDHYGPHNLPGRKYRVYGNPDPEMRSILLSAASYAMN
jgi:sulfatase-modifying factor enzyme 1